MTFRCHICGKPFESRKPQDPERDRGFGTCQVCTPRQVDDLVKHHFMERKAAEERTEQFA